MDTTVADTLLGSLIDGRYRIRGRVARGGMATVYTAMDERLERTVALKIIHPSQATSVFVDRFTDEAKTIARLTHPNVVAVYDQGRHEGLPYLVMEFVQGRTLREVLAHRRRLNPGEALAILEQMLSAIAAAHRAGLVHRDVKPENVLVAEAPSGGVTNLVDCVVKVADFGLARAVEASAEDAAVPGQLMATVAYVAPELVTAGHADARTDVYSAGIVLFEMLTGRVPYDGVDPVEVAWQHVDNDVPAPSGIVAGLPGVLDDLVARATRRDPGARPTDAGALLAEVAVVRDDLGAANAETALLRQVAARPSAGRNPAGPGQRPADATAILPASVSDGSVPSWARLPQQASARSHSGQRRRMAPIQSGLLGRLAAIGGGDRSRQLVLVAVAAMVLTLIVSTWWLTIGRYTEAPQLVNMPRSQAEATATRNGFTLLFGDPAYSETAGKDVVLSQDPPYGKELVKGGTITLILSLGPERYPVPDLSGLELAAAKGELETARLKLKEGAGKYDDDVPKGIVISSDPKSGTSLKPGQTVTVIVSKGRAPISVPDMTGRNINEARAELQALGLVVVEQYKDSDQPTDQVIGQSPKAGSGVERDTEVKLEVSKGSGALILQRFIDQPCQQARQTLEGQGFRVRIDGDPNATVRQQNPPENTQVGPQSEVVLQCSP
jgi:beta-lactam-binding protein with PASTA domain/serine/threonine protein kinase